MIFKPPAASPEQSGELPRAIARLAYVGGAIVTVLVPLLFLAIGYQGAVAQLDAAVNAGVKSISGQWQARATENGGQLPSPTDLARSLAWLGDDVGIRVTDSEGATLAEENIVPSAPRLTRSAFFGQDGRRSWQLELSRSLRPLLLLTLIMLVPGLLLGWMTFMALKDVPMRAFRLALQEIAGRKATEERLAKSLSLFAATLESTADGIFVTDVQGRAVVANQRFIDLWKLPKLASDGGFDRHTLPALAEQVRDPSAFVAMHKDLNKRLDVDHGGVLELRDGRLFEWNSRPQYIDGGVVGRVSSFRDITERKRAEALLAAEKEVLELVVCGSPLRVALRVLARHVEVLSGQMFCAILFHENTEESRPICATGPSLPNNLFDGLVEHGEAALLPVLADVREREKRQTHGLSDEFSGVIEDVAVNPAWEAYRGLVATLGIEACFAVSVRSAAGNLLGLIVAHYRSASDQTPHDRELSWVAAHLTSIAIERRHSENRLRLLAHYDALTLLPNRDLFRDRLTQALAHAERHDRLVAVMFLDLDRFKTVNDTLGHDAGDRLLREISARLRRCVREEDTVARLGGDEFTVILEQINRADDAAVVANKIVEALAPAVQLNGHEAFVTPSIGITIFPSDGPSAEKLLKNADTAMYRAKEEGGNGFRFFTPEMNALAAGRLELESGLRRALERDEFVVYYQPKLDLASQRIIGAEALLRWNHPERGLVPPGEFIPILEETGLIEQVGLWILRTVCLQMRAWQDAGLPPLTVAVNLSARQLQRNNLSVAIGEILDEAGLPPQLLELEVTESMLMYDPKRATDMLGQIRAKGVVHIDVDDFGTGYSSLSYLKRFPIDAVKLDKSFVDGLPHEDDDVAISRAVIALAHSLKLTVIAEGVETEEQLGFLHRNGCNVIQGFIVSRALPADDFAWLVREPERIAPCVAQTLNGQDVAGQSPQPASRGRAAKSSASAKTGPRRGSGFAVNVPALASAESPR